MHIQTSLSFLGTEMMLANHWEYWTDEKKLASSCFCISSLRARDYFGHRHLGFCLMGWISGLVGSLWVTRFISRPDMSA